MILFLLSTRWKRLTHWLIASIVVWNCILNVAFIKRIRRHQAGELITTWLVITDYYYGQAQLHFNSISVSRLLHSHFLPLIDRTHSAGILQAPSGIMHLLNFTIFIISSITESNSRMSSSKDSVTEFDLKTERVKTKK